MCFSYFKEAAYNAEEGIVRIYLKGRPVVLHCPTALEDNYDLSKALDVPEKKLKLDWVYPFIVIVASAGNVLM